MTTLFGAPQPAKDLQKRPTKETYKRDLPKRPSSLSAPQPAKDLQKRPTKETNKETYKDTNLIWCSTALHNTVFLACSK